MNQGRDHFVQVMPEKPRIRKSLSKAGDLNVTAGPDLEADWVLLNHTFPYEEQAR